MVVVVKDNIFPVRVRDIAHVYKSFDNEAEIVRINGNKALTVAITKESDGNIIKIARDIENKLKNINLPSGVYYKILFDSSETIKNSIKNVANAIWQRALFSIIVLMIYLWDIKSVSIIGISIPISVITTFILMYFFDITINIISLSGLVLGVGMMVDNSIVVLENIFYYSSKSKKENNLSISNSNKNQKYFNNNKYYKIKQNFKSAILGSSEVSLAITASTLTSVCVFLPFLFVKGQIGQMFNDLCLTVSISLLTSLFVAITIVPLLASRLISLESENNKNIVFSNIKNFVNNNIHKNIEKFYLSLLIIVLKNKKKAFIFVGFALIISLISLLTLIGKEGYPVSDEGTIISRLRLPVGSRVEFTDSFIFKMEDNIKDSLSNNMAYYESRVRTGRNEHHGEVRIKLVDKEEGRKYKINKYVETIRNKVNRYPGRIELNSENVAFGKPKNYSSIIIELVGDDLERGYNIADSIIKSVSKVRGIRNVLIKEDDSSREMIFDVNRDLVSKIGVNVNTIANIIRTSFSGNVASKMRFGDSINFDSDIIVRLEDKNRKNISGVHKIMIPTPNGIVPISSLANINRDTGPMEIKRKNEKRIIEINADSFGRPITI